MHAHLSVSLLVVQASACSTWTTAWCWSWTWCMQATPTLCWPSPCPQGDCRCTHCNIQLLPVQCLRPSLLNFSCAMWVYGHPARTRHVIGIAMECFRSPVWCVSAACRQKLCPKVTDISFVGSLRLTLTPLVDRIPGFGEAPNVYLDM